MQHANSMSRIKRVSHEIDMLIATFVKLEFERLETMVAKALVDSFCVHATNLSQFFQSDGGADALRSTDFTDSDYRPMASSESRKKLLRAARQRLNPLSVSVVTARRIGSTDRREIFIGLTAEVERFTRHLDPALRSSWKYCPE